jgi:hypothetical protein
MDFSLMLIMLFSSCLALTCCIFSLADHSKKGQVLFRLWK